MFLGQRIIRKPKGPKRYVYTFVCDEALASVMRKVKALTGRSTRSLALADLLPAQTTPMRRGYRRSSCDSPDMKAAGLDNAFWVLFAAAAFVGGLSLAGVLSKTAVLLITLLLTLAIMVFIRVLGGARARSGVLLVMIIGVLSIAPQLAPDQAPEGFYSAAAQVIPVLLLVLAIELRLFRLANAASSARRISSVSDLWLWLARNQPGAVQTVVFGTTLALLIAGELQALDALANKHPENASPHNVYTAVAAGLAIVGFVALFGEPPDEEQADKGSRRSE